MQKEHSHPPIPLPSPLHGHAQGVNFYGKLHVVFAEVLPPWWPEPLEESTLENLQTSS